jgi:arginase
LKQLQYIEVKSEIAAGTRGASLGIDALKVASINLQSSYFIGYEAEEVQTENQVLFEKHDTPNAKYVDTVYEIEQRVCDTVSNAMKGDKFPLVLAGDHSTAAGTISGIKDANPEKRLGVIWIDAHADLHTPYTTPSGNMHGMPLAMVCGVDNLECKINDPSEKEVTYWNKIKAIGGAEAKINIEDIVFVVARDLEKPEIELLKRHNIKNFTTDEVRTIGVEKVAEQALAILSDCDMIYISFDVDSMDAALSMGTGTPVPNGLSVEEAIELNCLLVKDDKVCAWEIVEVNPTLDTVNMMAENALQVLEATTEVIKARL